MSNYVELGRRFRDLTNEEQEDPSTLAMMGDSEPFRGDSWDKVLQSGRVVILATAGSGKTKEMQAQVARLRTDGKHAFFIPIEALDKETVKNFLAQEAGDEDRWEQWLSSDEDVWIFLDSVDELKLVNGKLEKALPKVAVALGAARDRAHIILSCRPTDWRPVQDMETFRARLPPRAARQIVLSPDEAFLAPFEQKQASYGQKEVDKVVETRIVFLLPLSRNQIEVFAAAKGVADPKALSAAIDRGEAWSFARRPLDLQNLIASWMANGSIGSLLQQHEADIANSLRDDDERPDAGVLSYDQAREGAERLALAMLMTKSRTIRSLEQQTLVVSDNSALDATAVLSDWDSAKIKALLRRPIFDPATYGRIRFHHRSVQEYLAAAHLLRLRARNLPRSAMRRLLLAETYGERIVIPSMRPVAAWLAQTDLDIRREVLAREPEVLLLNGDPASLPLDARSELVGAYVSAYSAGSWRGLEMPIAEIRRLAKPDLGGEIRKCWSVSPSNQEVIEFLLELIWLGAIHECADIAFDALMNSNLGPHARVLASRALADCGRTDLLRTAADDALANPANWTNRIYYSLIENIYPAVITSAELEQLILRVPEPKDEVGGFSWALYNIAEELEPGSEAAVSLRELVVRLIWDGRLDPGEWYKPKSRCSRMSGALARLCLRELERPIVPDTQLIHACAVANRLDNDNVVGRDELDAVRLRFQQPELRAQAFWIELEIMDTLGRATEPFERMWRTEHDSLIGQLRPADRPWLLAALDRISPVRSVALVALVRLWLDSDRSSEELAALKAAVSDDVELTTLIVSMTTPQPPNPELVKLEQQHEEYKRNQAAKQQENKASWIAWKAEVDSDPAQAFTNEKKGQTLSNLIRWLRKSGRDTHTKLFYANWRSVRAVFGDVIADGFEREIRQFWRQTKPPIWSGRKVEERNSIWGSQHMALTGLAIEATGERWAFTLTEQEARRAAEWGLVEINGVPEWYGAYASVRKTAVTAAINVELKAELTEASKVSHPHTLSALRYGAPELRILAVPVLIDALNSWPTDPAEDEAAADLQNDSLSAALQVVIASGSADKALCDLCETRFFKAPAAKSGTIWLQGLCAVDLKRGIVALKAGLETIAESERSEKAIRWVGVIFGERGFDHYGAARTLDVEADLLVEMVLLAYTVVRREDDVEHDGVYTPDFRDEAESARNRIISALLGRPGQASHQALLSLSEHPLFSYMLDRLRLMARQRAALDSEAPPLSTADYKSWEQHAEFPPRNRDELFLCMINELEDIQHDVKHHDFTDRGILAPIEDETKIQPVLAKKLSDAARDRYQVVREDEVADKKETDIRLLGRHCPDRAVVEVKIGDSWSVTELETALDRQVVGQYLRHHSCSAGCLLVTYAGRKGFEEPGTGVPMTFEEVVARLKGKAAQTEAAEQGRIRLGVVALDLRSPLPHSSYVRKKEQKALRHARRRRYEAGTIHP